MYSLNDHPCYIQNCVITNPVLKRLVFTLSTYSGFPITESELPVLFHPEELPTNNTGLLKFR